MAEFLVYFTTDTFDSLQNNENTKYLCSFLLLTIFGATIKNVEGANKKRWLGSCVGLVVVYFVMGMEESLHFVMSATICAIIIKKAGKERCHVAALVFMFSYNTAYRVLTVRSPRSTSLDHRYYMLMQLVCKMVGVAFEIHYCYAGEVLSNKEERVRGEGEIDPTFSEMLHYAFSFLGMNSCPYIRYRTYDDYLHLPFARAVGRGYTIKAVLRCILLGVIFCAIDNVWPVQYILSQEFSYSCTPYKIVYIFIMFESFQFWLCSGFSMSQAVASSVGLGAYPVQGSNQSGHGPSENYAVLRKISDEEAKTLKYDFKTLSCVDVMDVQFSPWLSVMIRGWNKSIQYFMGVYVYKVLPRSLNKSLRFIITMALSALWHGIDLGFALGMITPVYIPAENVYRAEHAKLYGWKAVLLAVCHWLVRTYLLGFMMLLYILRDSREVLTCLSALSYSPAALVVFLYALFYYRKAFNIKKKSRFHQNNHTY